MFNPSFYPTPPHIAAKMLEGIDLHSSRSVLEPSAGKGDLCDAIMRLGGWRERARQSIHCCEIEPELQATLRGKGYFLVGGDFLSFRPDSRYSLIVMNPPFSNGEKHLLRAWEILHDGDVVCLLNADSMRNPLLSNIVEQHGAITDLGHCFEDAFRKTSVRVALVRLHKKATPIEFTVFGGKEDQDDTVFGEGDFSSQVATFNTVRNLVTQFDRAREIYAKMLPLAAELKFYASRLTPKFNAQWHKAAAEAIFQGSQDAAYNDFVSALKMDAWQKVFETTKARNLMSAKVKADFDKQKEDVLRMAFSEENITGIVLALMESGPEILRRCVLEAFDLLTSFDKKNKVHIEGWKTNDAWRVNHKVIVPVAVYDSYNFWVEHGSVGHMYGDKLDDIDRALAYLNGRRLEDVLTVRQALQSFANPNRAGNPDWIGKKFCSDHFELIGYKKGTLHMTFRDKDLWERFNVEAARGKNWLPDDYQYREKAARKGAIVPMGGKKTNGRARNEVPS